MKKTTILCVGLCAALAFTSCKSSESAYKKAYEKAKQYDTAAPQQAPQQTPQAAPVTEEVAVVAPVEAKPANETRVVDNLDNVSVRQESVTLINGSGLKDFSVIVGSFGLLSNAEGLQQRLKAAGYDAQIVKNEDKNMYRVVASSFAGKADAVNSRDQLRGTYPDAWLLLILPSWRGYYPSITARNVPDWQSPTLCRSSLEGWRLFLHQSSSTG